MVVVRVVAAHDLASFEQPVGLVGMPGLRPGTGFATADLIKALGVFPCIKINQTAQPVRDGPPPHVGILTEKFQAAWIFTIGSKNTIHG